MLTASNWAAGPGVCPVGRGSAESRALDTHEDLTNGVCLFHFSGNRKAFVLGTSFFLSKARGLACAGVNRCALTHKHRSLSRKCEKNYFNVHAVYCNKF